MNEGMDAPRLTIELVPATCWLSNVRDVVSRAEWDLIRRAAYRASDYRCAICGGRGRTHPVECHEIWHYDDERHIQRLVGMVALCPACHMVKHIGSSEIAGRGQAALQQLARVNRWSIPRAARYRDAAFDEWEERSEHLWTLELSMLSAYGIDASRLLQRTPEERVEHAAVGIEELRATARATKRFLHKSDWRFGK